MNNSIEAKQMANGDWKLKVKTNLPYFQHEDFKTHVEEFMEENGFPILKLVGVDE